jgi:hypothetical protein
MADRFTYSHMSTPMPTGLEFLEQYADRLGQLFNASVLPLTGVGGTGNAVTATLDPALTAGLVAGMKLTITWGATNSGGMTLAINGGAAVPVLDAAGAAMTAGGAQSGARALLEYVAGSFRVLGGGTGSGLITPRYFWRFTASGTWVKPSGLDDDALVTVEAWGGGAGGGNGMNYGGGGGGAYGIGRFRLVDLASSITVSIGAGGSIGVAGGTTTFGSLLTAHPGGPGNNSGISGGYGGGGGGSMGAGVAATSVSAGPGGRCGGGAGGIDGTVGADASTPFGGGGGGGATLGGAGVLGGGGGGGGVGAGGPSLLGGAGGARTVAGSAPGGGGGALAAGARGEVRVWL